LKKGLAFMGIIENLRKVQEEIPGNIKVVMVTKTRSIPEMLEVYNAGYKVFGENKAQELSKKQPLLPSDIEWHFIGHLQTNKVRLITPFIHTIHSIDSFKLLKEVDKEAKRSDRMIRCLLQFYIATEETKFGLDIEEARELLGQWKEHNMQNVLITGLMGMASFSDDQELILSEFRTIKSYFNLLKTEYFGESEEFKEISIGMSSDYLLAISEGSTMLRLGTVIFGERRYL
jgi:PLP dependent protein